MEYFKHAEKSKERMYISYTHHWDSTDVKLLMYLPEFSLSSCFLLCGRKTLQMDQNLTFLSCLPQTSGVCFNLPQACIYAFIIHLCICEYCILLLAFWISHHLFQVGSCWLMSCVFNFNSYLEFHCTLELVYLFSGLWTVRFFQFFYYKL